MPARHADTLRLKSGEVRRGEARFAHASCKSSGDRAVEPSQTLRFEDGRNIDDDH
jgi:hypothetical protein